jgi:hypothetical protein
MTVRRRLVSVRDAHRYKRRLSVANVSLGMYQRTDHVLFVVFGNQIAITAHEIQAIPSFALVVLSDTHSLIPNVPNAPATAITAQIMEKMTATFASRATYITQTHSMK